MPLGLYLSVPFCRTKCSYCNFASDVFSKAVFQRYTDRLCSDIEGAPRTAEEVGGTLDRAVDSIYLGGGTPTLLDINQLRHVFVTISQNFKVQSGAEITVECAPGTLTQPVIDALVGVGVNRVSLGVQSFVDEEARAVGRLHTRQIVLDDISRLRSAGVTDINVDLIAGLPHQTAESWQFSLSEAIASGAPHVSVYMLEVDEDSRLGRELIAGGTRYHAHFVPQDELTADFYETACDQLNVAGIKQYEISNFARDGRDSIHNLKYWTRRPYFGFGVDAHSMLRTEHGAVRFSAPDSLEQYVAGTGPQISPVSVQAALEETFFLGLRLKCGLDLRQVAAEFGQPAVSAFSNVIEDLTETGLLVQENSRLRLTPRGRLISNDVFERFIATAEPAVV